MSDQLLGTMSHRRNGRFSSVCLVGRLRPVNSQTPVSHSNTCTRHEVRAAQAPPVVAVVSVLQRLRSVTEGSIRLVPIAARVGSGSTSE
jgi:hypothetical protein